jgi:pantoate--beta-alanine ligase
MGMTVRNPPPYPQGGPAGPISRLTFHGGCHKRRLTRVPQRRIQPIDIITTVEEMQRRSQLLRQAGRTLAFVPTMGFLHEGHLALMREGRRRADVLVASIYVNPTQFAPGEDFETYPRDMEKDCRQARSVPVDILFTPDDQAIYADGCQTFVTPQDLANRMCGLSRPIFFRGVATVVTKLFHMVNPHIALFGEKDFQQLTIIRRMVKDLNFPVEIVGVPTVREPDGLAMSSRNAYLSSAQRPAALSLSRSLQQAQTLVAAGENRADKILSAARDMINVFPDTEIDYIVIVDIETLEDVDVIDRPVRMAMAVKVGATRLIDNMPLTP